MNQISALVISLIVEAFVSASVLWLMRKKFYLQGAIVAVGSTLLSHPFAWMANKFWLRHFTFAFRALIIEILVILFEAIFYKFSLNLKVSESILVSLLANMASFTIGLILIYYWA